MKCKYRFFRSLFLLAFAVPVVIPAAGASADGNRPLLMAHYMPWYQTPEISGYWGWHWTMNHFNPDQIGAGGRREIASVHYPLTGPYDSSDEDILEYQALLFKVSGIDGVLVDWYGSADFWDYGTINNSTGALFDMMERAGLSFAIVYEDQTIKHRVNNGNLLEDQALAAGVSDLQYMADNWFGSDTYLKIGDRPVLLTFGPQYFYQSSEWETLFSASEKRPLFFTLDNVLAPAASGAYPWPPMWKAGTDGILSEAELNEYLTGFYRKANGWDRVVAGAFPGFDDIYREAGVSDGYGYLDPRDGETFNSTLERAVASGAEVIQLVTWNDYGEGTVIEPTVEFGYSYLTTVQACRAALDSSFRAGVDDLPLPLRLFRIRKEEPGDPETNRILDQVFDLVITDRLPAAKTLLDSLEGFTRVQDQKEGGRGFALFEPAYPNPFNAGTRLQYRLSAPARVEISVYNARGREVDRLLDQFQAAGTHSLQWNGSGLSSGLYLFRFCADSRITVRKCLKLD